MDKFEKSNFSYGETVILIDTGDDYTVVDIKPRKGKLDDLIVISDSKGFRSEYKESEIESYEGKIIFTLSLKGDVFSPFYTKLPLSKEDNTNCKTCNRQSIKSYYTHQFIGTQEEFSEFLEEYFNGGDYPLKIVGIFKKLYNESA